MSAEEWEEIKSLFASALAVPIAERPAYLVRACGDRSHLLAVVQELLDNHLETGSGALPPSVRSLPILSRGEVVANRYRITRFLARGGMGEVYEVFDERLRCRLALKVLRTELAADKAALARFERELLVTRDVAHDGLCRLFDLVEHQTPHGAMPCLTMELLVGESLAELLLRQRPLAIETALPWIRQIGDAVATLHRRHIVHRDLKPSNVMLASRDKSPPQAIVMDFGLAKVRNSETELFESQVNLQAGAPYFMAPELLRDEKPSIASDVYSFGLLIDEMVTSSRAFAAESLQALYFAKLWEAPTPPCERATDLPEHWNRAILRCLASDPAQRFATIAHVVQALEAPPAVPRKSLRRRFLMAAGFGAPVVLGGLAVTAVSGLPVLAKVGVFDIENNAGEPFEHLCRGTVVELMRRLSGIEGIDVQRLYVISRPGAAANQRFSLAGSLAGAAGQLQLNMQLYDHAAERVLWSEDFGQRINQTAGQVAVGNLLEIQAEIAERTVNALESALGFVLRINRVLRPWRRTQEFAVGSPTSSNLAFDHFLRGQTLLQEGSPTSIDAAIESLDLAVKEDPRFALAFAALTQAHLAALNFDQRHAEDHGRSAKAHAERALAEDPQLPESHAALGAVRQRFWDWQGAMDSYDAALRLRPRFPRALRWRAGLVLQFGRFDEAVAGMEEARQLDPYDRTSASGHGLTLLFAGRVPEAIALLEDALNGRDSMSARFNLGEAYTRQASLLANQSSNGLYEKALQQAAQISRVEATQPLLSTQLFCLTYSHMGDTAAARPYALLLEQQVAQGAASPGRLARIYSIQRDLDRAIALLERALLARDTSLGYIKVDPFLENVRRHPRFPNLVAAMRLT
jgi:tetratricopeptide (TPR) repeat protein/tRNA A-37 threonylcarbamoyl transferase component Bud32